MTPSHTVQYLCSRCSTSHRLPNLVQLNCNTNFKVKHQILLTLKMEVPFPGNLSEDHILQDTASRVVMYPRGATIFAAVSCIVFIIVGIIGNLLTVLSLSKCVKLRNNATTAFVISLSVADLIFCTINLPLTASRYIHEGWVWGDALCTLFPVIFYGNVGVSLLSMTAITINRYILIAHHTVYERIYKRRNVAIMIAFVWIFSFSLLIPPLSGTWGRLGYQEETFSCTILSDNGRSPKKFLFLFGFLLPCMIIIASYSCIFYKVRQSRLNVSTHSPMVSGGKKENQRASSLLSEDLRLTRLMLLIFCSFLICFLPLMVVNVFDDDAAVPVIHVLASVLAWMSSCINPVMYAGMSRQYRQAYIRFLLPNRHRKTTTNSGHNCSANSRSRSGSGTRTVVTEVGNGATKMQMISMKCEENGHVDT